MQGKPIEALGSNKPRKVPAARGLGEAASWFYEDLWWGMVKYTILMTKIAEILFEHECQQIDLESFPRKLA